MTHFDVLERHTNIQKHYLLEASAGTGKTFSIENIVVRLLIDDLSKSIDLERILIVTFTRAATRDLKSRVRSSLEKAYQILSGTIKENIPDYLLKKLQGSEEEIILCKRKLELALNNFDQAQIFTIHGFCAQMLSNFIFESHFNIETNSIENNLGRTELKQVIRDFLRTEIRSEYYSPAQLEIVIKENNHDIEKIQGELLKYLDKDCSVRETNSLSFQMNAFLQAMQDLKNQGLTSLKLKEDFLNQSAHYKKIQGKSTELIEAFFDLFDKNSWSLQDFDYLVRHGLLIFEFRDPNNLKKNAKIDSSSLHYPHLLSLLEKSLKPIIDEARSYEFILSRMIRDCRALLLKYLDREEKYRENDLLNHMLKAVDNSEFKNKLQRLFHAVIIDEFQDTDPIQWEIFRRLFLENSHHLTNLYLVGDPKQSIYAFRQADIYTYLSAAKSLGKENLASLDTNYRSQPSLVNALNKLFNNCPQIFSLPAAPGQYLNYISVNHKPNAVDQSFSDTLGSIHFPIFQIKPHSNQKKIPTEESEENGFFPFLTKEIIRLHEQDSIAFRQFAVLIKDKYQGKRLGDFFDRYGIPYSLQRQSSLNESLAWDSLKELLEAVLHPRNESALKVALGNSIIGWNYKEIQELEKIEILEEILSKFHFLKKKLLQEGFGHFIYNFLQTSWHGDGETVVERLLQQEQGDVFYDELLQISSLLMEHQSEYSLDAPEKLIKFLEELKTITVDEEEKLKKFTDPTRNAVSILTTYNSKGLEFDIVFAYGLMSRSNSIEKLIPERKEFKQELVPCIDEDEELYKKYCEEVDAEKMRQLYVALTRARYRLYVPVATYTNSKVPSLGTASPLELFINRLGKQLSYQELYEQINSSENGYLIEQFIQKNSDIAISYEQIPENIKDFLIPISKATSVELTHPPAIKVSYSPISIQSFTSLSRQIKTTTEIIPLDTPQNFNNPIKNSHTLPSSNLTGKLLHKILEIIPLNCKKEDLIDYIKPLTKETDFESWNEILAEIAYQATNIQIDKFKISSIDSTKVYRETEFLYPYEDHLPLENMVWEEGYLKGVIDLIFYHEDCYYLIDWKSNWLGQNNESYSQEAMQLTMQHHHYTFQAYIYKEALKRYLKLVDPRPFDQIYGGCYYIFLRGLNPNNQRGILKL